MEGSLTGRLLIALPALDDPNFERTVVLVLDHDEDGALGVVLNRASGVELADELDAWSPLAAAPAVVFGGGPVEPTAVVALGRVPQHVPRVDDEPVVERVHLVDLSEEPGARELEAVRVFAGYAGWGPDQLEDEIAQGAWTDVAARPEDVFTDEPQELWRRVLARQSDRRRLLASFPADPARN